MATLKDRHAQLGGRLVPRLSLVGVPGAEMNGAQVHSDWQRAFTLAHGKQVASGPSLKRSAYSSSC